MGALREVRRPHGNDDRFTPEKQQDFWAAYLHDRTATYGTVEAGYWVSYTAAFEAFDLHWKAEQSKMPIEEDWGPLGPDRKPYPAFSVWQQIHAAAAK